MKSSIRQMLRAATALIAVTVGGQTYAAGNVTAVVVNDELRITGDNSGNQIEIEQTVLNRYRVKGLNGTKVNGKQDDLLRVKKGIRVTLNGGNDELKMQGEGFGVLEDNIDGGFVVNMGDGSDSVILTFLNTEENTVINMGNGTADKVNISAFRCKESSLSVVTGSGNDTVNLALMAVDNSINVSTSGGNDTVNLTSIDTDFIGIDTGDLDDTITGLLVNSDGNWEILSGRGEDTIELKQCAVNDFLGIETDRDDDNVALDVVTGQSLLVSMGNDDDSLALTDVTFDDALLDGGNGDNILIENEDVNIDDQVEVDFDN